MFTLNKMEETGNHKNLSQEDIKAFQRSLCASLEDLNVVVLDIEHCLGSNIHFLNTICYGFRTPAFHLKLCALLEQMRCVVVNIEESPSADRHFVKIVCFGHSADLSTDTAPRSEPAVQD